MFRLTLLVWLLPSFVQGAHILVDVTPKDIQKYDIQLTVEVTEPAPDQVETDAERKRIIYQAKAESKNINLRNCVATAGVSTGVAHVQVEQFKVPTLQGKWRNATAVLFTADTLEGTVTFPAADAEKTYLTIIDGNIGASYSYRFKLQDWVKPDEKAKGESP